MVTAGVCSPPWRRSQRRGGRPAGVCPYTALHPLCAGRLIDYRVSPTMAIDRLAQINGRIIRGGVLHSASTARPSTSLTLDSHSRHGVRTVCTDRGGELDWDNQYTSQRTHSRPFLNNQHNRSSVYSVELVSILYVPHFQSEPSRAAPSIEQRRASSCAEPSTEPSRRTSS